MKRLYIPIHDDDTLRPYQNEAKRDIFCAWCEFDDIMFQMPTGTGKTRLFTSIIRDINLESISHKEPVKILIIAHRAELIDQIDKSLDNYHVAHNVFKGPRKKRDTSKPVIVSSIQTITHESNADEALRLKHKVKYIIIDEAHHTMAETYQKLWDMFPDSKKLGVTATPWRMNHSGFCDLFQKLITSWPIKKFIKENWLATYSYYSLKNSSFVQQAIDGIDEFDSFGDYKESALERTMDVGKIRAQLLNSYKKLAWGKRGIIYSINKAHSKHICTEYRSAGLRIVDIDDETPKEKRNQFVQDFKNGKIDIIVNVNIFSEGFDCPAIEFIQLARPTKSLTMFLQQVGRGLRINEGKPRCIILDNVGMYNNFGLPDANRKWQKHFNGEDVDEEPQNYKNGNDISHYNEPDTTEGDENMVLIQTIEQSEPSNISLKENMNLKEYSLKGYLYKELDDNNLYDVWYDENDVHVKKIIRKNDSYYIHSDKSELQLEKLGDIVFTKTNDKGNLLLGKYVSMFQNLHTAKYNGVQTPHKALLLLAVMSLIEKGVIKEPRFNLSRELILEFMKESDKYKITKDGKYPQTALPYFHMRSEPFWSLQPDESCKVSFSIVKYNQLDLNSHFKYARIDEELFHIMQMEYARQKLRKTLEKKYNLNG